MNPDTLPWPVPLSGHIATALRALAADPWQPAAATLTIPGTTPQQVLEFAAVLCEHLNQRIDAGKWEAALAEIALTRVIQLAHDEEERAEAQWLHDDLIRKNPDLKGAHSAEATGHVHGLSSDDRRGDLRGDRDAQQAAPDDAARLLRMAGDCIQAADALHTAVQTGTLATLQRAAAAYAQARQSYAKVVAQPPHPVIRAGTGVEVAWC